MIRQFIRQNGLRQKDLATYLGITEGAVSQLVKGSTKLSKENLAKILDNKCGWDVSMLSSAGRPAQRAVAIPVLPFSAVAGYMSDNNGIDSVGMDSAVFKDFSDRGADCLIRVDGDSMAPRYSSGDMLAIRILRDPTFFQWGRVYVLSTTQGCVIKELFPDPDDDERIVCHSENSMKYPDYRITKRDILAVAIVVGHVGVE
ncbi:MAG: LexA family transcriptional regulator [Lachnospiraceae bacterium]|nr:LexA family transcriptional regulator [Kiritimatiellia bacterium]MBP5461454.1 LexA family transcriptional regulator [Lachnospiraceae bacterium]